MQRCFHFIAPILTCLVLLTGNAFAASGHDKQAWTEHDQYAAFPKPLSEYETVPEDGSLTEILSARAKEEPFNVVATVIFLLAIIHTFSAGPLNKLSHKYEKEHEEFIRREGLTADAKPQDDAKDHVSFKANLFHFLGEVEAVFGIWALALGGAAIYFYSWTDFKNYLSYDREFIEPMFVVVIMAIAASRPVLRFAESLLGNAAKIGRGAPSAWWLSVMIIAPLLGSFITEPAAMTIGAMLLAKKFYKLKPRASFAYGSLGLLFVNVSVGGTLTHFAAPPVLMVAGPTAWNWDTPFMIGHFGWKAAVGIVIASVGYYIFFKKELSRLNDAADGKEDGIQTPSAWQEREDPVPAWVVITHIFFLGWTVFNAHNPVLFVAGFLFFLAFVIATEHHQNHISMRSPLLVGFFLASLIVHGGCQGWWIQPVILALPDNALMIGATILTAFNDNAAITYLAAQVEGISDAAKYAVVAGAVTGGGLTVIANAPNPAGQSLLGRFFEGGISPGKLAAGAMIPTIIMLVCFKVLPSFGDMPASPSKIEKVEDHDHHGDHGKPETRKEAFEPTSSDGTKVKADDH